MKIRIGVEFNLKNFGHIFLSPGNVFWKKTSGARILISKKGDLLNQDLIKKLEDGNQVIEIEDAIDRHLHHKLNALYTAHSEEIFVKNKIKWRNELLELLRAEFVDQPKSQFELNMLAIDFFSQFTNENMMDYIEKDNSIFQRNLSIASSYAFCAFLLGYYEPKFLSNLFTSTLKNLMELGSSMQVLSLKEKIEHLRMQDAFDSEDLKSVAEIADAKIISNSALFERYDGSGLRQINSREMSDLEVVLVALNRSYSFLEEDYTNVLSEIERGRLDCEKKTLKMLQRLLYKRENEILTAI